MSKRVSAVSQAFVLHQWDWSETSLILDVFTRDLGRIAVVAKGAKRPYSQLRAVLLPFQRLSIMLSRPRAPADAQDSADILTLRSAEYQGGAPLLPSGLLLTGYYLNELLLKLLARQDPHERLFDAYADSLAALAGLGVDAAPGDEEPALRAFELLLLRETGVLPDLGRNTLTQAPLRPERGYQIRAELGLVPAERPDDASALTGSQCLAIQSALDSGEPALLRQACMPALTALRSQLRQLLDHQLGSLPLRSRQTQRALRRLLEPPAMPAAPA